MKGWTSEHIEKIKERGMEVNENKIVSPTPELLKKVKRVMKHNESDLQKRCVETFRLIYPKLKRRLFAIPNGGYRDAIGASILFGEGVLPGVSDLMLAIPKNNYAGMFIEMKTEHGRLSGYQENFIKEMSGDYKCVVCRSLEEFLKEVKEYLL